MFKEILTVKDQFGIKHNIQATIDPHSTNTHAYSRIKYITVDNENIRPNFEMSFQSHVSGKIFMIL